MDNSAYITKENRALQQYPKFSKTGYSSYFKEIDKFINDNLLIRYTYVSLFQKLWGECLGVNEGNTLKGVDGEFFTKTDYYNPFADFLGLTPLSQKQLDTIITMFAGRQTYWNHVDLPYLLIIAPLKHNYYPEFLPNWMLSRKQKNNYDQIIESLATSNVIHIGALESLKNVNTFTRLYNKRYDVGHWNGNALYLLYKNICTLLGKTPLALNEEVRLEDRTMQSEFYTPEIVPFFTTNTDAFTRYNANNFPRHIEKGPNADIFINSAINDNSSILVATDSFFRGTHMNTIPNSNGQIFPLAQHFQKYFSVHFAMLNLLHMQMIQQEYTPQYVIEEVSIGEISKAASGFFTAANIHEPKIMIAGERANGRARIELTPQNILQAAQTSNAQLAFDGENINIASLAQNSPYIDFPPFMPDDKGRITIMAKIESQVDTQSIILYAESDKDFDLSRGEGSQIKKGTNYVYFQVYGTPNVPLKIRFFVGAAATNYTILPIPSTEDIFEGK